MSELSLMFDSDSAVVDITSVYSSSSKSVSTSSCADPQETVLSAHDINYKVAVRNWRRQIQSERQLLNDVTCVFKRGLTAIMGPTGSGKTTLMDILASRKDSSKLSGQLLLDGKTLPQNFKCMVGYVVQDDTLMTTLTVRENLAFSASLRLPASVSASERKEKVTKVIKELGLRKCADTKVGNEYKRGVSGGERRRCSIGMELIISPPVLFLDEPTTGLDSDTAHNVLLFLKRLSQKGRIIIFSIHQPRYSIFSLFDYLLLLYAGTVVYNGPAPEALDFFATQGFHCEIHNNPPDFFMDIMNKRQENFHFNMENFRGAKMSESALNHGSRLAIGFRQSLWNKRLKDEADNILHKFNAREGEKDARSDRVLYASSFISQVLVVADRAVKNIIRNPQTSVFTIVASLVLSALTTAIFWQLREDPVAGYKDRSGVLFFLIINQLFFNMPAVDVFIKERKIFMHENVSGFYRVSVYFLVKVVCDIIPLRAIPAVIMSSIVYYSVGLNPGVLNFFEFMFTLFCITLAGAGLCFLISATVKDFAMAQIILAVTCIVMMLFGGFLISFDSIGPWLNWAQYLSFFKYALAALYINEFKDRNFCNANRTLCESGNHFLEYQQVDYQDSWHFWQNLVALQAYTWGLLTLTYVQLRRMKKTN